MHQRQARYPNFLRDWMENVVEKSDVHNQNVHGEPSTETEVINSVDRHSLLSCFLDLYYLDRINGERVELDMKLFRGKYILVFGFQNPPLKEEFGSIFPWDMIATCMELYYTREDFEMVVVTNTSYSPIDFNDFLACFHPKSLVVPFKNTKHRYAICEFLHLGCPGFKCLLVNVQENIKLCGDSAIEHLQKLLPERPVEFLTFFNRLVKSTWPVIREEQKNPRLSEGKCPIAKTMRNVVPEYPDDIKEMVSKSKKSRSIEIGRSFDIASLLLDEGELNYLDRNDGGLVEIHEETFKGKYVMLCCFHVPIFREEIDSLYVQGLVTTFSDLYSTRHDFKMVVVVKMNRLANYEAVFNHFMSGFPSSCLVVPFKDSKRRDFICNYLDFDCRCKCLFLDDNKSVLFYGIPDFVMDYGAEAFPFSNEHMDKLSAKDVSLWQTSSTSNLEELLQCNPSDVLDRINPDGVRDEVTISELNKKLVGLYLCIRGVFIPILQKVHQKCIAQQLEIEIVLIYLPFGDCLDPQAYNVKVNSLLQKQKIAWWRLPFNNSVSRRLKRLTYSHYDNTLIIVGPRGVFVDPCGAEIMSRYGIDGYPFTREGLVRRELKMLRELSLESLLIHGSRDYVLRGNDKIAMAELHDKNIFLYFDCLDSLVLYKEVLKWYSEIKAKDSDFEVVFVLRNNISTTEVEDDLVICEMPWLVCPFDVDHSASLEEKIFTKGWPYDTIVQFGRNGQVCSLRAQELLRIYGANVFPFGDNLRQDVISQFNEDFMRDMK